VGGNHDIEPFAMICLQNTNAKGTILGHDAV
jgi:hypothetical protein